MSEPALPKSTSLSQKATIIVVSKGITIASQMATIMFLTRLLSKETFGLLSFLLLAYTTVSTLAQLGLPESVFYFFERVAQESRKSLALLTSKTLFLAGIAASLLLVALDYLAPMWGFEVQGMVFPLIFLVLLELPVTPLPNVLIAIDRAKAAAWFKMFTGLAQFGSLVVPALLGYSLPTIVSCLVFYGALRFLFGALLFFRAFREKGGPLPAGMVKSQLRYSLPLGLSQILWGLNRQIDKYIVAAFLPVTTYAVYVVGSWEIPLIPTIAYSVASVMMPSLVRNFLDDQKEQMLALWNEAIKKVAIIVLPLTILFLLAAEEFIVILFSEAYIEATVPFRIYTLILLHRVDGYTSMLKAIGETRAITYSAILLVVINVALSIPLVLLLGMAGPPTATLVASMLSWFYILFRIRHGLNVSIYDIFPFRSYFKTLVIAALSAAPVFLLLQGFDLPNGIGLALKAVLYLLIYSIAASFAQVITKEDWRRVLRATKIRKKVVSR